VTCPQFANLPPLLNNPGIQRSPGAVSSVCGGVDLSEGCLITKTVRYTHQLIHWVNAVRNRSPRSVERLIEDLRIIPSNRFSLDDPCNRVFLSSDLHAALDLYGLFAVTASAHTLDGLITMIRQDNTRRQQAVDMGEVPAPRRMLNFSNSNFVDPEYEMVVLYPRHFLPDDGSFSIFSRQTRTYTRYFISNADHYLRESHDPNSRRLPTFKHTSQSRTQMNQLNVFLVILNADLKFRNYLSTIQHHPPATPLPNDVLVLIHKTTELVDLIYWTPSPPAKSQRSMIQHSAIPKKRWNY